VLSRRGVAFRARDLCKFAYFANKHGPEEGKAPESVSGMGKKGRDNIGHKGGMQAQMQGGGH